MTTEPQQQETFNNEHVDLKVTRLPQCGLKLDITVSPKTAQVCHAKAIKMVSHEVVIPGFRKGKAPQEVIKTRYGQLIQKEFVDLVLDLSLREALSLAKLQCIRESFTKKAPVIYSCTPQKVHFMVQCEAQPLVPHVNVDDISLSKVTTREITERDCERAIQSMVDSVTTFEKIEEQHHVQEGDYVDCEITEISSNSSNPYKHLNVSPLCLPSWLYDALLNLTVGAQVEGTTSEDHNFSEDDGEFKKVDYKLTLNAIWKGTSPALDDALAKKMGAESLETLRSTVQHRLQQQAEETAARKQLVILDNFLLQHYPFEVPGSYLEAEKKTRLERHFTESKTTKNNYSEQEFKHLESDIENSSRMALQLFFLYGKIAADHKIVAQTADVDEEFAHWQMHMLKLGQMPLKNLSKDHKELYDRLADAALNRKLRQFIISKAKLV